MAIRGTAIRARYWALSGGVPLTGDAANHTLNWRKDGVSATPSNAQAEITVGVTGTGEYEVLLTTTEATCSEGGIVGVSSTGGVIIVGRQYTFDSAPATIADEVLGRDVDNVEATAPQHCLVTAILAQTAKANTTDNAGYLTIYRTDGLTEHVQIPISSDASAEPIDGIG